MDKKKPDSRTHRRALLGVASWALAAGALFSFAEMQVDARGRLDGNLVAPSWIGPPSSLWGAFALGAAVYCAVVAALGIAVILCLRLIRRGRAVSATTGAACAVVLAAGFWLVLAWTAGEPALAISWPVAAALLIFGAVGVILDRLRLARFPAYGALVAGGSVAATATAACVANAFFLRPESTRMAADLSALWVGLGLTLSVIVYVGGRRLGMRSTFLAPVVAALLASAPVAATILKAVSNQAPPLASAAPVESERPNVLIVTADAMRADYCSAYGGSTPTPNIEALAKRGASFQNCISTAPWTTPSLDSLFSSKYPPRMLERTTGSDFAHRNLVAYWCDAAGRTFIDEVGDSGMTTGVFAGNWRISREFWLVEPFRHHVAFWPQSSERRGPFRRMPLLHAIVSRWMPSLAPTCLLDTTRELTGMTLEFLRQHRERPFFLWVHYFDPHAPYDPPQRFRTMEGPFTQYPLEGQAHQAAAPPICEEASPEARLEKLAEAIECVRSLYRGEIRYVDEALGTVLGELKRLGLEDNTVVCFSSDHGEELWDHNQWGHGFTLYQEQLHVPFILAGPGIKPQVIDTPASHIDFLPTLAGLLDLDASPHWHGTSLAPLLRDGDQTRATRECFAQGNDFPLAPEGSQAVISGRFKLIRGTESGRIELFDLHADPVEKADAAGDNPDLVRELEQKIHGWADSFEPDVMPLLGADTVDVLPEEIEGLRATGYLD